MTDDRYEQGIRDAVRFCKTHTEHFSLEPVGEKYKDNDAYYVTIVAVGKLLPRSMAHCERSIEIWTRAALEKLSVPTDGLKSFTDEQLLAELVRRNRVAPAPTKSVRRAGTFVEIIVGIGRDESASIIIANDGIKALGFEEGE